MNFDQFLLHSEDEMDFLPIIPLNESEQDNRVTEVKFGNQLA